MSDNRMPGESQPFYPNYGNMSSEEIIAKWHRDGWFPEDEPYGDFIGIINPTVEAGASTQDVYGPKAVDANGNSLAGQPVPEDIMLEE